MAGAFTIDQKITFLLKDVSEAASKGDDAAIRRASDKLLVYMKEACSASTNLLSISLPNAKEAGLSVHIAKDKRFGVFSWDTQTGGTMHFYKTLIEFVDGNKAKCRLLNQGSGSDDPSGRCTGVESYQTKDHTPVYLLITASSFSNQDHGRAVYAFTVKNGKLTRYPFFEIANKKLLNEITYSLTSLEWNDNGEIAFTNGGKTMRIPWINKDGAITGKFLNYQFDGNRFVYKSKG